MCVCVCRSGRSYWMHMEMGVRAGLGVQTIDVDPKIARISIETTERNKRNV